MSSSIMLSIDPGYDRCGWAILKEENSKISLVNAGLFTSQKSDAHFTRLKTIIDSVFEVIKTYEPSRLAIESVLFSKNVTTAMKVAEVKGAIIGICLQKNMNVQEVNPMQVKSTVTGNGKADKQAVMKMLSMLLRIPSDQKWIDDTYDAIAIGYAGLVLESHLLNRVD